MSIFFAFFLLTGFSRPEGLILFRGIFLLLCNYIPKDFTSRFRKNLDLLRYIFLILSLLLTSDLLAQLTAPLANDEKPTAYPVSTGRTDKIFIFCNSSGTTKGSIQADSPGGTAPYNFTWFRWDNNLKSFTDSITRFTATLSSTLTGLDEGGYRVHITDGGGYDTNLYAWVHLDSPFSVAKLQNFTCYYVALAGKAYADTFYYYDPSGGVAVKLRNGVDFLWSSDPVSAIPNPGQLLNPITFSPPLEDVIYNLQVTDSFGCTVGSSFPYTSIHVKADFTPDPVNGEAPLHVGFTNKSIHGETYTWEFGDDSISHLKDPGEHIYYRPGEYEIKLTVESTLHCVDSFRYIKIVVDPSELNVPNVFTPDGDGINDNFIVESKSLRSINVEIYSQSGIMVYSFSGEGQALSEWTGWDGNVNKSSRKAAPGVYYYLIRALGWDDRVFGGKLYRGFLYLYR